MFRKTIVGLATLLTVAHCGLRQRTYVVQEGTPAGELVIEWDPSCPPAAKDGLGVRIDIPISGHVCTSTTPGDEWHHWRYVLRGPGGVRQRLTYDEEVFNHGFISFGKPGCGMEGEAFFYRPFGSKKVEVQRDLEPLFRIRHSCDPSYHAEPVSRGGV